ncbi:hypothetical protein KBC55_01640 [Patescibacteria group bacterium]|nr:hypothetical protein [Patescibacteria group bacterium]
MQITLLALMNSPAQAQECNAGCVPVEELEPECIPELPDNCPVQIIPTDSPLCVAWLNDNGTWQNDVNGCWQGEPFTGISPYSATNFVPRMVGDGGNGTGDAGCALTTDGEIMCWGGGDITVGTPSGEEPYSSLAFGSGSYGTTNGMPRMLALNAYGEINVWGNTSGAFYSNVPTTSGFTDADSGYAVGCAVGITNSGVTCWGDDYEGLVTHASKPSSGTYTYTAVGRYVAGAVQSDGTLDMWGTTRSPGSTTYNNVATFIANRPSGTDIVSFEVNESGNPVGVAYHTDGTASIWIPNAVGIPVQMTNAPGWDYYGSTSLKLFKPQGPNGEITFRGPLEISSTDNGPDICGVINNPQGLHNDASTPYYYKYGDAICWSENDHVGPRVEAECVEQSW